MPMPQEIDPTFNAERRRSDEQHAKIEEQRERLGALIDSSVRSRNLAHTIAALLVGYFSTHEFGQQYAEDMRQLAHAQSMTAATGIERAMVRYVADRFATRFFSRAGSRGTWPPELRIPFELATLIRRAHEEDLGTFLPLLVTEARWLVAYAGARVDLDGMIDAAIAKVGR